MLSQVGLFSETQTLVSWHYLILYLVARSYTLDFKFEWRDTAYHMCTILQFFSPRFRGNFQRSCKPVSAPSLLCALLALPRRSLKLWLHCWVEVLVTRCRRDGKNKSADIIFWDRWKLVVIHHVILSFSSFLDNFCRYSILHSEVSIQ